MSLKKYILNLTLWLLIPYLIGLLVFFGFISKFYFPIYPFIILIFIGLGLPFYHILKQHKTEKQHKFQALIIANMFFKLLVSAILVILYILLIKTQTLSFVISYCVFYVVLLVFEKQAFFLIAKTKN